MIQLNDFLREVAAIAATDPTYRTGGRGVDGTCDCIGLIMGAMYRLGTSKYPMHSTNYFARYETDGKRPLEGEWQLHPGMIVYKDREDDSQLNARYKPGGRYYTGDPLDYYHVGVVTSAYPLEITHCTQTNNVNGIARDTTTKGWTQFGWVKGVTPSADGYTSSGPSGHLPLEGEGNMEGANGMSYRATVTAANGQPVKMRSGPNTRNEKNVLKKLAVGTVVEVVDEGTSDGVEWSTIVADGVRGYMMAQFLQYDPESGPAEPEAEPKEDGYEAIMAKLNEIVEILREMLADGARKDNEIQYTDTE